MACLLLAYLYASMHAKPNLALHMTTVPHARMEALHQVLRSPSLPTPYLHCTLDRKTPTGSEGVLTETTLVR